ncbi:YlcI/YnfO family protein [Klebsiella aerogenes]
MQDKKTKREFDRSNSTVKNIRFEDLLLEQINAAAGPGNFSSWVKDACREKLERLHTESKG